MASCIAVLTGDIIASRRLQPAERLSAVLDDTLALLATRFGAVTERYRGDGFQLVLPQAWQGVTAAVLLRAELIRHSRRDQRWDARLAIAIGRDDQWQPGRRLAEASAPPFVASGQALDALDDDHHLALRLEAGESECLALLMRYLDEMLEGWTPAAAEAVAGLLCHAESQQALAERLGISQPAVHKRLRTARWPLLQETLAYLERRLKEEGKAP
jgi:DNA-directed RNA polymerase specialized sigma24 family protein